MDVDLDAAGPNQGTVVNRLVRGALAGVVATVPMSLVVAAGSAAGPLRDPPPEQISATAAWKAGLRDDLTGASFSVAWMAGHLAYGGACGALYGALRPALPEDRVAAGLVWGGGVWAVSYGLLMPAMGLYPPPSRQDPARSAWMLVAHAVYGVALEIADRRIGRRAP